MMGSLTFIFSFKYTSPAMEKKHVNSSEQGNHLTRIISIKSAQTPMTFADFMQLVLYDSEHGYYLSGKEKLGWSGDYFTSSDLGTMFGSCMARMLSRIWVLMGRPEDFTIVEMGAGRGNLARDILFYLHKNEPEMSKMIRYACIDVSDQQADLGNRRKELLLAGLQQQGIEPRNLFWFNNLQNMVTHLGRVHGCVLSNELLDAMPVHILEKRERKLYEVYIRRSSDKIYEFLADPSSPELENYLDQFKIPWRKFPDGWRAEVNLAASGWMREVTEILHRGCVITIDYGDVAAKLYTRERLWGTLACYYRHTLVDDPYINLGQQDITAHVNFSDLIKTGRENGLRLVKLTSQGGFLTGLGIWEELEKNRQVKWGASITDLSSNRGQTDLLHYYNMRTAVQTLLNPSGLGKFKVLLQHRGIPGLRALFRSL